MYPLDGNTGHFGAPSAELVVITSLMEMVVKILVKNDKMGVKDVFILISMPLRI